MSRFLSSNGCRFFFDLKRNRKMAVFLGDRGDQIGNVRLTRMRD
jgi:hypothetical protein